MSPAEPASVGAVSAELSPSITSLVLPYYAIRSRRASGSRVTLKSFLVVWTQHRKELELSRLCKEFVVSFEPGFLIGELQVNVEILSIVPILIEIKYVWIVSADVKMIINS